MINYITMFRGLFTDMDAFKDWLELGIFDPNFLSMGCKQGLHLKNIITGEVISVKQLERKKRDKNKKCFYCKALIVDGYCFTCEEQAKIIYDQRLIGLFWEDIGKLLNMTAKQVQYRYRKFYDTDVFTKPIIPEEEKIEEVIEEPIKTRKKYTIRICRKCKSILVDGKCLGDCFTEAKFIYNQRLLGKSFIYISELLGYEATHAYKIYNRYYEEDCCP